MNEILERLYYLENLIILQRVKIFDMLEEIRIASYGL